MPLLFLGTAQDGGVPQAGCDCINCRRFKRSAASVALVDGKDAVLIDITPDFRFQYWLAVERFNVELSAIYLTHAHWGHYGGLPLLGREGWNVRNTPVFLSQPFHDFLLSNEPFSSLIRNGNITPQIIEENVITQHGITPVHVTHRDEFSDTFAFTFKLNSKSVLYMPDTDDFTRQSDDLIRSVDLAIIDGTFYSADELPQRNISKIPHPFAVDTIKRYSDIANRIIFTHLNHTNPLLNPDSAERTELVAMGFRVANDGDVIE